MDSTLLRSFHLFIFDLKHAIFLLQKVEFQLNDKTHEIRLKKILKNCIFHPDVFNNLLRLDLKAILTT